MEGLERWLPGQELFVTVSRNLPMLQTPSLFVVPFYHFSLFPTEEATLGRILVIGTQLLL